MKSLFLTTTIMTAAVIMGTVAVLPLDTAEAAKNKIVSAFGEGDTDCPSTSVPAFVGTTSISVQAQKDGGKISGDWSINGNNLDFSEFFSKGGQITGGKVTGGSFTLTGNEVLNTMCVGPTTGSPVTVTITGECGFDKPLEFRASDGEHGVYLGDNICLV